MISYNPRDPLIDRAAVLLDPANRKSYLPNIFGRDLFSWMSGAGVYQGTAAIDNSTGKSPVGGVPVLMTASNTAQPFTQTENTGTYIIGAASVGQTWTASVYVKADRACTASIDIFGLGSNLSYLNIDGAGGNDFGGQATAIGTTWKRITYTRTFTNASVKYISLRLDGATNGVSGTQIWFDGVQLEQNTSATTYILGTANNGGGTFKDISSNAYSTTMYGAVPFSTDGGGCWDFTNNTGSDGANSALGFIFPSSPIAANGNFVISCWVKNPTSTSGQPAIFMNAGGGNGYRFGVGSNYVYALGGFPYNEGSVSTTFASNTWYHVAVVYDRMGLESGTPQLLIYVNGSFIGTIALTAPQVAMATATPGLIKNSYGGGRWNGKLGVFAVYNGHATATEMKQLFASQRGRYGV